MRTNIEANMVSTRTLIIMEFTDTSLCFSLGVIHSAYLGIVQFPEGHPKHPGRSGEVILNQTYPKTLGLVSTHQGYPSYAPDICFI